MDTKQCFYRDLPDRIEDEFAEIDSDICTELRATDAHYASLFHESDRLQSSYHILLEVLEGTGDISLTADEHLALVRYLSVKQDMEDAERRRIYFCGHADSFAYLKKMGAF